MPQQNLVTRLYQILLKMGQLETNPVLQVINSKSEIQNEKKYPLGLLQFNQSGWRAYYHCHSNRDDIEPLFTAEHGHFHIFVRITKGATAESDSWAHLAALSMDEYGQPLRWFMVNHWVTAENWLAAPGLIKLITEYFNLKQDPLSNSATSSKLVSEEKVLLEYQLVEEWLLLMIELYQDEIQVLLQQRDQCLNINQNEIEKMGQNKNYYLLAEEKINLQAKFESIINP